MLKIYNLFSKVSPSLVVIFILALYLINFSHKNERWKESRVIESDASQYYVYLPATFIYQDFHFNFADSINDIYQKPVAPYYYDESGKKVQKFSIGQAIMEAPFFFIAHIHAQNDPKYAADGFSLIYHYWIAMSGIFYAILSLIMMRLILKKYFKESIVTIVLLFFALGSNFLYYATYDSGMAHLTGLFLLSLFFYLIIGWFENKSIWRLSLAAFVIAMATILRPTNIIFSLIWFVYIYESGFGYKGLLNYIKQHKVKLLIPILAAFIPIMLQLYVWKTISGNWVQYSYGKEGFFFTNPKVLEGVFSYRNGMLPYAPFLIFAFIGMFIPRPHIFRKSLIFTFIIFLYITYSWWCWWYGGALGARAMIESYFILALFLGVFLEFVLKYMNKIVFFILIFFLVKFSHSFMSLKIKQKDLTILHWDSMTGTAYWQVFMNSDIDANYYKLLENPDYHNAVNNGVEYPDFVQLDASNRVSEKKKVLLSEDLVFEDTLYVKVRVWGNFVFQGDPIIKVKLESVENGDGMDFEIHPLYPSDRWNEVLIPIYIKEEWKNKEFNLMYAYYGRTRCFYKPLEIITNKP